MGGSQKRREGGKKPVLKGKATKEKGKKRERVGVRENGNKTTDRKQKRKKQEKSFSLRKTADFREMENKQQEEMNERDYQFD